MITLRGAEVSEKLKTQVQESLNGLGRVPRLAIVRVGESPDDISYEKGAVKKMAAFGLEAVKYTFPENIPDRANLRRRLAVSTVIQRLTEF